MARLPMRAKLSRSSHRYRTESMIELFFPILEDFCPFFVQIAQVGLTLPRWGLILPRIPSQPLSFTQQSHPFEDMYVHKTPPTWTRMGQNVCFRSGQNSSISGQKKKIHRGRRLRHVPLLRSLGAQGLPVRGDGGVRRRGHSVSVEWAWARAGGLQIYAASRTRTDVATATS